MSDCSVAGTPLQRGVVLFETLPAMAFLCSPNTTRLITERENEGYDSPVLSSVGNNGALGAVSRGRPSSRGATDARRLSFSPQTRSVVGRGSVVVEDIHDCSFDSYTQSPPPLVLSRRPHSLSASTIRPVILRL